MVTGVCGSLRYVPRAARHASDDIRDGQTVPVGCVSGAEGPTRRQLRRTAERSARGWKNSLQPVCEGDSRSSPATVKRHELTAAQTR